MNFAGNSRSDCVALVEAFRVSYALCHLRKQPPQLSVHLHAVRLSLSEAFLVLLTPDMKETVGRSMSGWESKSMKLIGKNLPTKNPNSPT